MKRWNPRSLLVMSQVAFSVIALVGAGLFVRSLRNAIRFDPGFDSAHEDDLARREQRRRCGQRKNRRGVFFRRVAACHAPLTRVLRHNGFDNRLATQIAQITFLAQ